MTHYKAILLLIASDDEHNEQYIRKKIKPEWRPLFPVFKSVHEAYMDVRPDMRMLFVYANSRKEAELGSNDLSFPHIQENDYPGMISKTLHAMEHVHQNYDYDFIVRTNLSTFWDLNGLSDRLDKLPKEKCFVGHHVLTKNEDRELYIAGYDMVISRDIIEQILPHKQEIIEQRVPWKLEDLSLSRGILRYSRTPILTYPFRNDIYPMIMDPFSEDRYVRALQSARKQQMDHFRIKNPEDRNIDKVIMKRLLQDIYGKTL